MMLGLLWIFDKGLHLLKCAQHSSNCPNIVK